MKHTFEEISGPEIFHFYKAGSGHWVRDRDWAIPVRQEEDRQWISDGSREPFKPMRGIEVVVVAHDGANINMAVWRTAKFDYLNSQEDSV